MKMIEWDEFKGDYSKVKHFVETQRFDYAAEPLIRGLKYQVSEQLLSETRGQLAEVWNRIYLIRKESGYKTEEIAEEVLHEVEEWLEDLFEAGAIKKNPK
jgi:hypothetical protein